MARKVSQLKQKSTPARDYSIPYYALVAAQNLTQASLRPCHQWCSAGNKHAPSLSQHHSSCTLEVHQTLLRPATCTTKHASACTIAQDRPGKLSHPTQSSSSKPAGGHSGHHQEYGQLDRAQQLRIILSKLGLLMPSTLVAWTAATSAPLRGTSTPALAAALAADWLTAGALGSRTRLHTSTISLTRDTCAGTPQRLPEPSAQSCGVSTRSSRDSNVLQNTTSTELPAGPSRLSTPSMRLLARLRTAEQLLPAGLHVRGTG
jgi:hypothetical protein